jgi:hypothetical protein
MRVHRIFRMHMQGYCRDAVVHIHRQTDRHTHSHALFYLQLNGEDPQAAAGWLLDSSAQYVDSHPEVSCVLQVVSCVLQVVMRSQL